MSTMYLRIIKYTISFYFSKLAEFRQIDNTLLLRVVHKTLIMYWYEH